MTDYELDTPDRELLEKCKTAVEYYNDGGQMKDVLDADDFEEAIILLVNILGEQE